MLIIKWEGATEKSIQNNTTAPDVNLRTCIQSKKRDDSTNLKYKCRFLTYRYPASIALYIVWTP